MINRIHKFIFLHPERTGGTTVQGLLGGETNTIQADHHATLAQYYEAYKSSIPDVEEWPVYITMRSIKGRVDSWANYMESQHNRPYKIKQAITDMSKRSYQHYLGGKDPSDVILTCTLDVDVRRIAAAHKILIPLKELKRANVTPDYYRQHRVWAEEEIDMAEELLAGDQALYCHYLIGTANICKR